RGSRTQRRQLPADPAARAALARARRVPLARRARGGAASAGRAAFRTPPARVPGAARGMGAFLRAAARTAARYGRTVPPVRGARRAAGRGGGRRVRAAAAAVAHGVG